MGCELRSGVSFCTVQGRTIFLDIARDRYFRLSDAEDAKFRAFIGGGDLPLPSDLAALLVTVPGNRLPLPVAATPCRTQLDSHDLHRPSVWRMLVALGTQLCAHRAIRQNALGTILASLVARHGGKEADGAKLSAIAAAHRAADLWYSRHDRCLAKSIALLAELRRAGVSAELVFGVADRPFAAHCWVQRDERVLNDTLEHVRLFTPILVI